MQLKYCWFTKIDFIDSFKQLIFINVIHNICLFNYRLIFLYRYAFFILPLLLVGSFIPRNRDNYHIVNYNMVAQQSKSF